MADKCAESLADLMKIRAHNRKYLDSFAPHSLGTALGFRVNERAVPMTYDPKKPAVLLFVKEKLSEADLAAQGRQVAEQTLHGPGNLYCDLDVVTGIGPQTANPLPEAGDDLSLQLRGEGEDKKIYIGSQIARDKGGGNFKTGAVGLFVYDALASRYEILTAHHIALKDAPIHGFSIEEEQIGTTVWSRKRAQDENWYADAVDEKYAEAVIDFARVGISPTIDLRRLVAEIPGVGPVSPKEFDVFLDSFSALGKRVTKIGPASGKTSGTVFAFAYETKEPRSGGRIQSRYYADFLIASEPGQSFSTVGDSGALVYIEGEQPQPFGLLWGGDKSVQPGGDWQQVWSYATSLHRILRFKRDESKLQIVTEFDPMLR